MNNNTGPIIRINMTTTVHHNPRLDYSTIITVVLYHQASFDSNLNRHLSIHLLVKSDNVNIVEGDNAEESMQNLTLNHLLLLVKHNIPPTCIQ